MFGYILRFAPRLNLGPLIFNIFINDIFYFIQDGNLYNYADDNWVTLHHKELTALQGILQNEAKLMVEWFEINAMQANPDKFQGILLKGAKTVGDFTITVEGTEIAFVSEINALGVCIDDQSSFNAHVDRICTKASRQVNALQWLTGVLDYESRLAIYKSFIMSNFDYCPIEQGLLLYWLLAWGLPPSEWPSWWGRAS